MKIKNKILTLLLLIVVVSSSNAFDDQRKGFMLGIGLGISPLSQFKLGSMTERDVALGVNGIIGYGLDDKNIIAIEGNASFRSSKHFSKIGERTGKGWFGGPPYHGSQNIDQQFLGITWYHYFNSNEKSWFSVVGIGGYNLRKSSLGSTDHGLGYLLGAGYKLSKHIQVGTYYSWGESSESQYYQYDHSQISILATYLKF
jgi:hypothetical protein